jgi:hypothetical protein
MIVVPDDPGLVRIEVKPQGATGEAGNWIVPFLRYHCYGESLVGIVLYVQPKESCPLIRQLLADKTGPGWAKIRKTGVAEVPASVGFLRIKHRYQGQFCHIRNRHVSLGGHPAKGCGRASRPQQYDKYYRPETASSEEQAAGCWKQHSPVMTVIGNKLFGGIVA